MKVRIIGAGFSGLTLGYALTKLGVPCEIYEKSSSCGGLISSVSNNFGIFETAANGLLNSTQVEDLFQDVGAPLCGTLREARARFFFRGKPKRWPFTLAESGMLALNLTSSIIHGKSFFKPRQCETIDQWTTRTLGRRSIFFLATVLQGIYAGDPSRLSASLILKRSKQIKKPNLKGTVSSPEGMGQLMFKIRDYLQENSVEIKMNSVVTSADFSKMTVLATPAYAAADLLELFCHEAASLLRKIEYLPIVTVSVIYPKSSAQHKGFGCLFPKHEGFRAIGVLFNEFIFPNRSNEHSETWIFGGALDKKVFELSNSEITTLVKHEHDQLHLKSEEPLFMQITKWPKALPHYTIELERILQEGFNLPSGLHLHGNYLGGLGLAKILGRSWELAEKIRQEMR